MENIKLCTLFAFLLMAGVVTMQAQEYPYHLEEIRSTGDTVVFAMNYIDENTLLTLASKMMARCWHQLKFGTMSFWLILLLLLLQKFSASKTASLSSFS